MQNLPQEYQDLQKVLNEAVMGKTTQPVSTTTTEFDSIEEAIKQGYRGPASISCGNAALDAAGFRRLVYI